jgi:hypothetical protein
MSRKQPDVPIPRPRPNIDQKKVPDAINQFLNSMPEEDLRAAGTEILRRKMWKELFGIDYQNQGTIFNDTQIDTENRQHHPYGGENPSKDELKYIEKEMEKALKKELGPGIAPPPDKSKA